MHSDRLYKHIIMGLCSLSDGNAFEACVTDLLRDTYPTLVPINGGNDAGFDGAIATDNGCIPLICTITDNVIGNVRRNLQEYVDRCDGPKRAIVATSQKLTRRRRDNIVKAALELGVTIHQIHDQPDIANRLYRSSKWLKDLLGISGHPGALSRFPRTFRYSSSDTLIGRERDFEWLAAQSNDALLVGVPGSGKTFLHQKLAEDDKCLFVVDQDTTALTNDLRDYAPPIVVLDDAHTQIALLKKLLHLRRELRLDYAIHANCWPDQDGKVRSLLGLGQDQIHTLEPLDRDTVVEIIKAEGLASSRQLISTILDYAEGKPGLAASLTHACLQGNADRVWTGDELADELLATSLIDHGRVQLVLAILALGGDTGVSLGVVADITGESLGRLQTIITELGSGGVIEQGSYSQDCFQIRPPPLRAALVKRAFYGKFPSVSVLDLVTIYPQIRPTASYVLMRARQCGAAVDIDLIWSLIRHGHNTRDLEHFAWIDEECATRLIQVSPDHIIDAAPGLLHHCPDRTLRYLLILHDGSSDESVSKRIDEVISNWIVGNDPRSESIAERKRQLLEVAHDLHSQGTIKNPKTLGWLAGEVIQINFSTHFAEPGSGLNATLTRGVFPLRTLRLIAELWSDVLDLLKGHPASAWESILRPSSVWLVPHWAVGGIELSDPVKEFCEEHGHSFVHDIVQHHPCRRAVRTWAKHLYSIRRIGIDIEVDADFDLLFGDHEPQTEYAKQMKRDTVLFHSWVDSKLDMGEIQVIDYLADLEDEATIFGEHKGKHHRIELYKYLADQVTEPLTCLSHMCKRRMNPLHVQWMLNRSVTTHPNEIPRILNPLFESKLYQYIATNKALVTDPLPSSVWISLDAILNDSFYADDSRFAWLAIPIDTRQKLLTHTNAFVRGQAALAEWIREPEGTIPPALMPAWESAILDCPATDYQLKECLTAFPHLAFRWLASRVRDPDYWLHRCDTLAYGLIPCLTTEDQKSLLALLSGDRCEPSWVVQILDASPELLADWFELCTNRCKLKPLNRPPDERGIQLIRSALELGVSAEDIAKHFHPRPLMETFQEQLKLADDWIESLTPLLEDQDRRMRLIAEAGIDNIREWRSSTEHTMTRNAIRGRG